MWIQKKIYKILYKIIFSIKILSYRKKSFSKIFYIFRDIDKKQCVNACFLMVFRQFLIEF